MRRARSGEETHLHIRRYCSWGNTGFDLFGHRLPQTARPDRRIHDPLGRAQRAHFALVERLCSRHSPPATDHFRVHPHLGRSGQADGPCLRSSDRCVYFQQHLAHP